MDVVDSLRERKRQRTRETIAQAALAMFLEHGFDHVSCAAVAARAEVSKPTLFKHFPTKEDLVVHVLLDHENELATVVRDRSAGTSPLDALHRWFLDGLTAREATTGLNDSAEVRGIYRMMQAAPTLSVRLLTFTARRAEALAEALASSPDLRARIAAHQITVTLRVLADENISRIGQGEPSDAVYPDAVAAADQAFAILRAGIGGGEALSDDRGLGEPQTRPGPTGH